MIWKYFSFAILIGVGTISCTSLITVNSISENNALNTISKYYDSDSQIRYMVSNDEEYLHLNLKTNYQPTIAKIMRAGLKIYLDKNGKKNKSVYIQYPIGSSQDFEQFKSKGPEGNKEPDLNTLINSTSIGAAYVRGDQRESFTTLNPKSHIQLAISTNKSKELVYDLIIPFTEITPNGRADLFNLSIGIVTGSFDIATKSPLENEGVTRSGAGQPNGSLGIPQQGASSGNASYSGGGTSGSAPHQGYTDLNEESKFWFLVGLYR